MDTALLFTFYMFQPKLPKQPWLKIQSSNYRKRIKLTKCLDDSREIMENHSLLTCSNTSREQRQRCLQLASRKSRKAKKIKPNISGHKSSMQKETQVNKLKSQILRYPQAFSLSHILRYSMHKTQSIKNHHVTHPQELNKSQITWDHT